jgi:hypothetical protein
MGAQTREVEATLPPLHFGPRNVFESACGGGLEHLHRSPEIWQNLLRKAMAQKRDVSPMMMITMSSKNKQLILYIK